MSATETESPQVIDLTNLPDGRIEDMEGFESAKVDYIAKIKAAIREAKRYTGAIKDMAESRVRMRSFVILPSGFPDWAANSDSYSLAVQSIETPLMAGLGTDAARRLGAAVRQHVSRTYLLRGVVDYCLKATTPSASEADAFHANVDAWKAGDQDKVLTDPSPALIKAVRKHYGASKLTVPAGPFAESHEGHTGAGGPGAGAQPSPLGTVMSALGGITQIVPRLATAGLLRALSDISAKLIEGKMSEIPDRPKVAANLARIAQVASLTAKAIGSEGTSEAEEKALQAAYFDPKKEGDEIA